MKKITLNIMGILFAAITVGTIAVLVKLEKRKQKEYYYKELAG